MRIQSKFRDFYDYATPYRDTDDRAYFWDRQKIEDTRSPDSFPKITHDDMGRPAAGLPSMGREEVFSHRRMAWRSRAKQRLMQMYVTVGDTSISFFRDHTAIENNATEVAKADAEGREIEKEWPVYTTEPDFKQWEWKRWDYKTRKDNKWTTAPVTFETSKYPGLVALQMEHKTPLIMFTTFGAGGYPSQYEVVINPRLLDYGIQHVLTDAQQVYQELEMWFTDGKFDADPVGNPEQTNVEKVVAHGFDKKVSFRGPNK